MATPRSLNTEEVLCGWVLPLVAYLQRSASFVYPPDPEASLETADFVYQSPADLLFPEYLTLKPSQLNVC